MDIIIIMTIIIVIGISAGRFYTVRPGKRIHMQHKLIGPFV